MKEKITIKRLINGFTLGVTIGMLISIFINYIFKTTTFSAPTPQMVIKYGSNLATLICVVGYGLIGLFSAFSSIIFNNEQRSLLKSTIIHFLLLQLFLLIIGYFFSWLYSYFTLVLPISIFVYLIIWIINYLIYKNEIKQINSLIK